MQLTKYRRLSSIHIHCETLSEKYRAIRVGLTGWYECNELSNSLGATLERVFEGATVDWGWVGVVDDGDLDAAIDGGVSEGAIDGGGPEGVIVEGLPEDSERRGAGCSSDSFIESVIERG